MQKIIQGLQNKTDPQPTPVWRNIGIPNIPTQNEHVIDMNSVRKAKADDTNRTIVVGVIRRPNMSPTIASSSECGDQNYSLGGIHQFAIGDRDGDGDGDGGDEFDRDGVTNGTTGRGFNNYHRKSEFVLVKSSNINIAKFTVANLITYPYLQFYKFIKRLMHNQGEDGELLIDIFTEIETEPTEKFTNAKLKEMVRQYLKVAEFNRAILSVPLNYTDGIAKGMVEYGVDNGFDAWRRLYNHYLPFAEDLQQILIQELYSLLPGTENNTDTLFNQVERITELYTRVGKTDDAMSDKWIKVAVLRNLPKRVTKDLALQFKDANIVNGVRNIVNIYLHDHQTGMPRGQADPMLCAATSDNADANSGAATNKSEDNNTKEEQTTNNNAGKEDQNSWHGSNDLNVAIKGNGKCKKGGRGYGECWHCGEWGHPRRECLHINEFPRAKGTVAALKGGKQGNDKGTGKFGKGKNKGNGKGKWGKGYNSNYNYSYNYRSPGKGVGKGLNKFDEDWYNAWGADYNDYNDYDHYGDDYNNWGGHIGNVTMMLERGGK